MSDHHQRPPQARRRGLLWLLFVLPGTIILWWQYYFPKPGEAWAAARRKDHPVIRVLYSIAFWLLVLFLTTILIVSIQN